MKLNADIGLFTKPSNVVELFSRLTEDEANEHILVLTSAGINCYLHKEDAELWSLTVLPEDYHRALFEIENYHKDNEKICVRTDRTADSYDCSTGVMVALALLASHIAIVRQGSIEFYIDKFGANAFLILHGELYRTVTALMIHSDGAHLAGNMAGAILFIPFVCGVQGYGLGLLAILATGILGNFFTALLYQTDHISMGASTSVFGAIGILAAHQSFRKFRMPDRRLHAWLPVGGGLCLLGWLSAGEHTDILAHLFGLGSGLIVGSAYESVFEEKSRPLFFQHVAFCVFLAILVLSWLRL